MALRPHGERLRRKFADLAAFKGAFPGSDADTDFDYDGQTNFADLAVFKSRFLKAMWASADPAAACP